MGVYAELHRIYPEFAVEDGAVVEMLLRCPATVTLVACWGTPLGRYSHAYDARVEVRGPQGTPAAHFGSAQHLQVCSEVAPHDRNMWIAVGGHENIRAEPVDMLVDMFMASER